MRTAVFVAAMALVAGCAGTPEVPPDTQALRDYVEVGELEQTDRIRTHGSDSAANGPVSCRLLVEARQLGYGGARMPR